MILSGNPALPGKLVPFVYKAGMLICWRCPGQLLRRLPVLSWVGEAGDPPTPGVVWLGSGFLSVFS